MKTSNVVIWLSLFISGLALIAAAAGVFWPAEGDSFPFTTLRGQIVQIYGRGLYCYDTVFTGAGFRGTDVVTLLLGIPLLLISLSGYRRGSLRSGLLLMGMVVYFLYVYASMALTAAYNNLFLIYIALFSASFFALGLTLTGIDHQLLRDCISTHMPRWGPAIFMFASGLATLVIWLSPLLSALRQNQPPALLGSYTTQVTDVLDLGLITPATFIAGGLIIRRAPLGYLITCALLVLETMLLPLIIGQTVSQLRAGISFTPGEIIGPIVGFTTLGFFALWVLVVVLRHISATPLPPTKLAGIKRRERLKTLN